MRVALVSEHASPLATLGGVDAGGQNVYVGALAAELARRGDEVTVYTRRDGAGLPRRVEMVTGVTVEHVDAGPAQPVPKDSLFPFVPEFSAGLARAWRRREPDVVHAHFWMSGWAAEQARRRAGAPPPLVQTFHALGVVKRRHQGDRDTSPAERVAVERELLRSTDRVIATCTDEVFELLRLGADPRTVSVVPCGVDLDRFTPDGEPEARVPGRHRLVVVSRLVERKGVGNAIAALAGVPGAELVVAGGPEPAALDSDPEVARLRRLARDHGVAERVELRGRVERDKLPALLRSADTVVCVPWYEPFGMVPLEAMACGVPVVASAVGGMIDTVVDGVAGIHVPPRRPDVLAEVLRDLLADPQRRARLGQGGRQRARARYGWPRVAESVQCVYRELSERRPAAGRAGG